jgi:hypothetical protein
MGLIALASARSPGLTTLALALAATWPEPRKTAVVELDPDGGTLAASVAANPDPGLTSLAAAGRHYLSPELIASNLQQLPNGQPVLLAPPSPDRTVAALKALSPVGLGETLQSLAGFDVLADCGRIDSASPALGILQHADAAIFVIRPTVADVVGLRDRLQTLDLSSPQLQAGIVIVMHGPHTAQESGRAFRLPVIGTIAWDPRGAEILAEGRHPPASSKLLRSAASVASDLAAQIPAAAVGPAVVTSWKDSRPSVPPASSAPPSSVTAAAGGPDRWGRPNGEEWQPDSSDFWRRHVER